MKGDTSLARAHAGMNAGNAGTQLRVRINHTTRRMGARGSALSRRIAQQTHPPPPPPSPHPHLHPTPHLPPTSPATPLQTPHNPSAATPRSGAVAHDFARWQQAQQQRQSLEHSITQRMLEEQRRAEQKDEKVVKLLNSE